MTITNYDGIIAARGAGNVDDRFFGKNAAYGGVAGVWYSALRVAGYPGSLTYTDATSAGIIPTATNSGAIPLSSVASTSKKYLLTAGFTVSTAALAAVMLVDVLWAGANVMGNVGGAQVINSAALTRSTNGIGCELLVVVSSAIGATAQNLQINYTGNDDATHNVTIAMTTAAAVNRVMPAGIVPFVPLNAGVKGVKSIQSAAFSSTNAAGSVDIHIVKVLTIVPTVAAYTYVERDTTSQIDGIVEINVDSAGMPGCIGQLSLHSGTGTSMSAGFIRTCQG